MWSEHRKWVILAAALIVIAVGGVITWHLIGEGGATKTTTNSRTTASDQPLLLKSISFNLGYYDPKTNLAGDMEFTHVDHNLNGMFNLVFSDFGTQDPRSPNDPTKRNPQPTFILPLGTKVHSLVDGVVVEIKDLYSNDQTIWVASSASSHYIYETEHILNPLVKKGDRVTGGQIIGEVSTHGAEFHSGFGIVEIGILYTATSQAQHLCPFNYLDPSIKVVTQQKILAVHQAWEIYLNRTDLYDDAHSATPGCFSLDPVSG